MKKGYGNQMEVDEPRPRGRPKDAAKRTAILDAARTLFLEHGADGVSLDTVIAASKVSKATFYSTFGDRAALVEAVIRRESERVVVDAEEDQEGDLVGDLTNFGMRLLGLLTDPDIMGFERLIATATRSHPDLPGRFFEAGPGRSRKALADRIAAAARAGELTVIDPMQAAEDLVGLWQGMMRVEMTMSFTIAPTEELLRQRAARGVQLFMKLYGPPSG